MDPIEHARTIIQLIVLSVVDDAGATRITAEGGSPSVLFRIYVGRGDLGKVIGKQGRTARSIRTIALAMGMKLDLRFTVDIAEGASSPLSPECEVNQLNDPPGVGFSGVK